MSNRLREKIRQLVKKNTVTKGELEGKFGKKAVYRSAELGDIYFANAWGSNPRTEVKLL